jgi:DNA repair exonuclease SbcCD ATPase subunit
MDELDTLRKAVKKLPCNYDQGRVLLEDRVTSLASLPAPVELGLLTSDTQDLVEQLEREEDRVTHLTRLLNRDAVITKGLDTNQQQLKTLLGKIEGIQGELALLQDTGEDIADLNAQLEALEGDLRHVTTRKATLQAEVATGEERLATTKREIERVKAVLKEKESTLKAKSDTESLQKFLRKNRAAFAGDIWEDLLAYASSLVSSTTEGRLSGLSRSTRGEFTVEEWDKTIPVTEASGAQKSIIGLAVRAAMAKTFYGKGLFLLLDEVSSDASDVNAAAIAGMLKGLDMQVISVTHRQGEASNAGTIINLD